MHPLGLLNGIDELEARVVCGLRRAHPLAALVQADVHQIKLKVGKQRPCLKVQGRVLSGKIPHLPDALVHGFCEGLQLFPESSLHIPRCDQLRVGANVAGQQQGVLDARVRRGRLGVSAQSLEELVPQLAVGRSHRLHILLRPLQEPWHTN